jgi:ATP-binding cassette, subfamily B, bacterial PglK
MEKNNGVLSLVKAFFRHVSKRKKIHLVQLSLLMILATLAEVVSLGLALPFLSVITNPENLYTSEYVKPFVDLLNIQDASELLLPVSLIFILTIILSSIIRASVLFFSGKLSASIGSDIGLQMFSNSINQEYVVHTRQNSSKLVTGILNKVDVVVGGILAPILTIVSSILVVIGITFTLFYINPTVTLFLFFFFSFILLIIFKFTREILKENSFIISSKYIQLVKILNESLGGIRDILLEKSQDFYCDQYKKIDVPMRFSGANNKFISGSPRFLVEMLGMIFITLTALYLVMFNNGIENVVPLLGVIVLGAQKLLPVLQQTFHSVSTINGNIGSFKDAILLLEEKIKKVEVCNKNITLSKNIKLIDVSFKYSIECKNVLNNININIEKGSCVGFIGETGSGKSTLVDIIMSLLSPSSGILSIDGITIDESNRSNWQRNIAHVPQHVYLFDSSIKENIAFSVNSEDIDNELLNKVVKLCKLDSLVESLPDGLNAKVGEMGVRLSGGQRQRIGIARALYKRKPVIVLDEATSALDGKTEEFIMNSIRALQVDSTVLMIAHRMSTLRNCNKILEVRRNGQIIEHKDVELITQA